MAKRKNRKARKNPAQQGNASNKSERKPPNVAPTKKKLDWAKIGGLAALGAFLWAIFVYFFPPKTEPKQSIQGNMVDATNEVMGNNAPVYIVSAVSPTERPIDLSYSNSLYFQGQELFNQAMYEEALIKFSEALDYHKSTTHADEDTARIYSAIGLTYRCTGDYDKAIKAYSEAVGILKAEGSNELGYAYYLRAIVFEEDHQLEKALLDAENSRNLLDRSSLYTSSSINWLIGRIQFASAYSENSVFDTGEILGYTYDDSYNSFCLAIDDRNLPLSSIAKAMAVPKDYHEYYGIEIDPNEMVIFNWIEKPENDKNSMTSMYPDIEMSDDGKMTMVLHTIPKIYALPEPDKEIATILIDRALTLNAMGYYQAAVEDCETVLKIYDQLPNSVTDRVRTAYFLLAESKFHEYLRTHDIIGEDIKDEYYELMKKGLDWSRKWTGDSFETGKACETMAMASMMKGQYEEGLELLEEAKRIYDKTGADPGDIDYSIEMTKRVINGELEFSVEIGTGDPDIQ